MNPVFKILVRTLCIGICQSCLWLLPMWVLTSWGPKLPYRTQNWQPRHWCVRHIITSQIGCILNNYTSQMYWELPKTLQGQNWIGLSSSTDKQSICVNTQLKSSKKQLKLDACIPKSNSFEQYAITCDVIAYHLVHFFSIWAGFSQAQDIASLTLKKELGTPKKLSCASIGSRSEEVKKE